MFNKLIDIYSNWWLHS